MNTAVVLGAGMIGRAIINLLNRNQTELVAIGDNDPAKWDYDSEIQVLPVKEALRADPDIVIIGVLDEKRTSEFTAQALECGFTGRIMPLSSMYDICDVRAGSFRRIADRIEAQGIKGAIADVCVHKGDFTWQLSDRFPDRDFYIFDTFKDVPETDILARIPYTDRAIIRKGTFEDGIKGLEDISYAIVSLKSTDKGDILKELVYFYDRLASGGVIILHNYNNLKIDAVRNAVSEYESAHGRLLLLPLSDLHGTAIIIKA